MTQVALRQTVEEAECKNPRATKAIKDNSYMHILDLRTKLRRTKKRRSWSTKAIDGILKTSGFQVKGWQSSGELDHEKDESQPVWNNKDDVHKYKVEVKVTRTEQPIFTKRNILSQVARILRTRYWLDSSVSGKRRDRFARIVEGRTWFGSWSRT